MRKARKEAEEKEAREQALATVTDLQANIEHTGANSRIIIENSATNVSSSFDNGLLDLYLTNCQRWSGAHQEDAAEFVVAFLQHLAVNNPAITQLFGVKHQNAHYCHSNHDDSAVRRLLIVVDRLIIQSCRYCSMTLMSFRIP